MGYKGGLKGCERQFGISRGDLENIDGFFAVFLWREYEKHKNLKALDTLLAYNIEDVLNLEYLIHRAYNLKIADIPFKNSLTLEVPQKPINPFSPDLKLVSDLYRKIYGSFTTTV